MSVLEYVYHCAACRDIYDSCETPFFECPQCGDTFCSGCEEPNEEKRESKRCEACHADDVTDRDCRKILNYLLKIPGHGFTSAEMIRDHMRKKGLFPSYKESSDEEEEEEEEKKPPPAPKPVNRSDDIEEEGIGPW